MCTLTSDDREPFHVRLLCSTVIEYFYVQNSQNPVRQSYFPRHKFQLAISRRSMSHKSFALAYTRLLCETSNDLKTSDIRRVRTVYNLRGFKEIGEWRSSRDRLILPHRVTVDFDVHACDYPNKAVTNHGMRSTHAVSHECRHTNMVQCCLLQSTTWPSKV